jgi:hypothetical protein
MKGSHFAASSSPVAPSTQPPHFPPIATDHSQRLFKERPGKGERAADAVFGGTGLSDDEEEGGAGEGVIAVKGPLEFLRHPQVWYARDPTDGGGWDEGI